jgi:phosphoadenosine phosphosulfate reductase
MITARLLLQVPGGGARDRRANTSAASVRSADRAAVSSLGTELAAPLKLVSDVDPAIPVLLVDTGWLFSETLPHRDAFLAKLGLTDVRSITPDPNKLEQRDLCGPLVHHPDACCALPRSSRSPTHWHHLRPG